MEPRRALDEASRKMQRKSSEIVRMALQAFLQTPSSANARPADRVRSLVGSLESGLPHLAERHREYIVESLKHDRWVGGRRKVRVLPELPETKKPPRRKRGQRG